MVSSLGEERRKVCLFCLNAFETYDVNQKCCSSLCEIDYKAKLDSRKQKDDSFKEQIWELMSDPDEEYGLFRGLLLSQIEIDDGLSLGSFTPGTIIRHMKSNKSFQIVNNMLLTLT